MPANSAVTAKWKIAPAVLQKRDAPIVMIQSRGWLRVSMQTVIASTSASSSPGAMATP